MKFFKTLLCIASFLVVTQASAADFQHLIDGSLDLANLKTKSDLTGESKDNKFELIVKYRNQVKPSFYLVTGFLFIDSETTSSFGLELGVEKNLFKNSETIEIGPGIVATFTDGEYGNQDYRTLGFTPYAYIRNFIGNSRAYIMWTFGYQIAWADRDGADEDLRGIAMSFGFGLGF